MVLYCMVLYGIGMGLREGKTMTEEEKEIREDARRYILESIDSGIDPMTILDDLASFYDGDPIDLF